MRHARRARFPSRGIGPVGKAAAAQIEIHVATGLNGSVFVEQAGGGKTEIAPGIKIGAVGIAGLAEDGDTQVSRCADERVAAAIHQIAAAR